MFRKKKDAGTTISADKLTIIANGTSFKGDIESDGNIRIDGKVIGHVKASGNTAIGKTGVVEGDIIAAVLKISGQVTGNIEVSNRAILDATASIFGDLKTKILIVEDGASVNGKISMESTQPYDKLYDKDRKEFQDSLT
jgi:cytoskeletal protein CcmA (bactofilin family)